MPLPGLPTHKSWCAIGTLHGYCNCFLEQRQAEARLTPAEVDADRQIRTGG